MESLLSRPNEMDFNSTNPVATWTERKQMKQLYLNAVMGQKAEEEKYSMVLFVVGERGRETFNTWTWQKVCDAAGNEIDKGPVIINGGGWSGRYFGKSIDIFVAHPQLYKATMQPP